MKNEIKIVLPPYKVVYSACFIVLFSLIRGVTYVSEIGIALEAPVAMLSLVFCSDTYVMEIVSKRSEVHRIYPIRNRVFSQYKRMLVQIIFIYLLSLVGYMLFVVFQHPVSGIFAQESKQDFSFFFLYMGAIIVTISFWGFLSNLLACLFKNVWGGIGGGLLLWLGTNSKAGEMLFGKWNLFSYALQDVENGNKFSWLCGKGICLGLIAAFILALPIILKKRG